MQQQKFLPRLVCLQWLLASTCFVEAAFHSGFVLGVLPDFPSSVHLRASVITNTVPLAWYDANYTSSDDNDKEPFPQFRGIQPDILRHLIKIAKDYDNVTLTLTLEEAPAFSYSAQFERLASDCGFTANENTEYQVLSEEECNRFDLLVADIYGYPTRSIRAMLTPPWSATAGATVRYLHRTDRVITTLDEAEALQEPVCLLDVSHFDLTVMAIHPKLNATRCRTHQECLTMLKQDACALFVEDRLQLRYITTQDATLEVTPESFNENFIVWPISARLDPLIQQLLIRWMYQAKAIGVLDELDKQYFSIRYCPLGKAGVNCDQPCSATHGTSNRHGHCVCESTRWTGADCSIEVLEDKNLIPSTLKIISYVMIAINFLGVAICGTWLVWKRETTQVKVSQPLFLGLVLLGCVVSTSTIFAMAVEDANDFAVWSDEVEPESQASASCMAIPWLYSLGFSITFGSLFAKIRRVYLLFKAAATMQRVTVTAKETLLIVCAVLLVDIAIMTVWTVVDPLKWYREAISMDQYGYVLTSVGYCYSDHFFIFGSVMAAHHFIIMAVATYLIYAAREIPTQFSEGKYVAIAMISNLQIFVVGVPILVIIGSDPQTGFFVRSVIIWMNDLAVLVLIFGNLMYSVHFGDRGDNALKNSKVMIRDAMATYQSRRNKRKEDSIVARRSEASSSAHVTSSSYYKPNLWQSLDELQEEDEEREHDRRDSTIPSGFTEVAQNTAQSSSFGETPSNHFDHMPNELDSSASESNAVGVSEDSLVKEKSAPGGGEVTPDLTDADTESTVNLKDSHEPDQVPTSSNHDQCMASPPAEDHQRRRTGLNSLDRSIASCASSHYSSCASSIYTQDSSPSDTKMEESFYFT